MILTGEQIQQFEEALKDAFRDYNSLKRMLRYGGLNKHLENIAGTGALNDVVAILVDKAESENWLKELLESAIKQNPNNPKLNTFVNIMQNQKNENLSAQEAKINAYGDGLNNPIELNQKQADIFKKICRIDFGGDAVGTGFLIAPDMILTNYHVIKKIKNKEENVKNFYIRFDYKNVNGIINLGEMYSLADNWLVAQSLDSNADNYSDDTITPQPNQLDYAVLRLSKKTNRGYIAIPDDKPVYEPHTKINIMQHPQGDTLKESSGNILGVNANETRLFYTAETAKGSSGSPCFNVKWELIALHNSGIKGQRNAGIPIFNIKKDLIEKNIILLKENENITTLNNNLTSQKMNRKTLYNLLNEAYTNQEILQLCFLNPEFKKLHDNIEELANKDKKIIELLGYCERHSLTNVLLNIVKEERPVVYQKYIQ